MLKHYQRIDDTSKEKLLTFIIDNKRKELSCLNKKYFDSSTETVGGYVSIVNNTHTSKYGELIINDTCIDIYTNKKFYQRVIGYLLTEDGYLAVYKSNLFYLILLVLVLITIITYSLFKVPNKEVTNDVIDDTSTEIIDDEYTAKVVLPDGYINFDDDLSLTDSKADIKVILINDEVEHVLINTSDIELKNGFIPDLNLDWTILDFELVPGIYQGYIDVTYPDKTSINKQLKIIIVSSVAGNMNISYSEEVNVDLSTNTVNLCYTPSNTGDSNYIEVLIDEYLIARSNLVNSEQTITSLNLINKIQKGTYQGVIRVFNNNNANIHADIVVTISVK